MPVLSTVVAVEVAQKLETVKLPRPVLPEQLVADMGAFVEATKKLVAAKRDATDVANEMYDAMKRASMIGVAVPEAALAHEVARLSVEKLEKVMLSALRTLSREVEGDEDEEE
jgi:hypothetical protein